jgi:uncharacterized membrane protein
MNSGGVLRAWVSRALMAGVVLAGVIALAGGVLFLAGHGAERAEYAEYRPVEASLTRPAAILAGTLRGDAPAVMQLAVLVLIATPVLRVALAALAFAAERDRLYVAVSLVVLLGLVAGLAGWIA